MLPVPPRNESTGLAPRNQAIGHSWSALSKDNQIMFRAPLFPRLAHATSLDLNHHTLPNVEPLTPQEQEKYVDRFKALVNLSKITNDIDAGCLGLTKVKSQKRGRQEISKIVCQVSFRHSKQQLRESKHILSN